MFSTYVWVQLEKIITSVLQEAIQVCSAILENTKLVIEKALPFNNCYLILYFLNSNPTVRHFLIAPYVSDLLMSKLGLDLETCILYVMEVDSFI